MDKDANSWIRRAKFSHTICHRLDSFPQYSSLKLRPRDMLADLAASKQRSVSPIPKTVLPDTFKEAQSEHRRCSTPNGRRKVPEKKLFKSRLNMSSTKSRKDSMLENYLDYSGGKLSALEDAGECSVDRSKLFLGLKFAHGAHSRLYHGNYKDEQVAVKIIRVPDENADLVGRLEKEFNQEVTLLCRLHHENIIRFVASCRDPPVFCIITEYLSKGSLRSYLHKLEHKALPLKMLVAIGLDIARGLEYIHSQGFMHRDLKPENILIDENFRMKIADFGSACEDACCDVLREDPGTFRWMAPEMIKHKSYGRKVDVYSFGLILWEMMSGNIPYENMTPIQAAFAVVNKNLRPIIPKDCPSAMGALIEQCWSLQPEKRPEIWQVVKVLEQFESLLANEETLGDMLPNMMCQDHKKGFLHWIQKLTPADHPNNSTVPKPKLL